MVDTTIDELDSDFGPGDFSLREAIAQANATEGHDTITFAESMFGRDLYANIRLAESLGQMKITDSVSILIPNADWGLVIQANNLTGVDARVFDIAETADEVNLTGFELHGGTALQGGAIRSLTNGELILNGVWFNGNNSQSLGGSLFFRNSTVRISEGSFYAGSALQGGAIYGSGGSLFINNSELSYNDATGTSGGGGAIYGLGTDIVISNSTISGGVSETVGGGIAAYGGSLTINNSTVAFNSAAQSGGGVWVDELATLNATSSLFASNTASSAADVFGTFASASHTLVQDANGAVGIANGDSGNNLVGQDPLLGDRVGYNGWQESSYPLMPGSPAINAGLNPDNLPFDQRGSGFARVFGSAADIGAFEVHPLTLNSITFAGESLPQNQRLEPVSQQPLVFVAEFQGALETGGAWNAGDFVSNAVQLINLASSEIFPLTSKGHSTRDGVSRITLSSEQTLTDGDYRLSFISSAAGTQTIAGVLLDGEPLGSDTAGTPTGDGVPGGDYHVDFTIDHAPLPLDVKRIEPTGSLLFHADAESWLHGADDTDQYTFGASAGQYLALSVAPPANETITARLTGPDGFVVNAAVGDNGAVMIQSSRLPADGTYTIEVTGAGPTLYAIELALGGTSESLMVGDSSESAPFRIDREIGSGASHPWTVLGHSNAGVSGIAYTKTNAPQRFVDISDTGTLLDFTSSVKTPFTSTVGNTLFPAGDLFIHETGGISKGDETFYRFNYPLPVSEDYESALLPFWGVTGDEAGSVFVQETLVDGFQTLIVQWNEVSYYNDSGSGNFQLQLFAPDAPILARFVYPDVDFENEWNDGGKSATIGVQARPDIFAQVGYDEATVQNGDVIEFSADPPQTTSDVDAYTFDWSATDSDHVDIVFSALGYLDPSRTKIELLNTDGQTVLATATNKFDNRPVENADLGIYDFALTQHGTYTIRVTSDTPGNYSLAVFDSSSLELEPNDAADGFVNQLSSDSPHQGFLSGIAFAADFSDGDEPSLDGFTIDSESPGLWHVSSRRGSDAGHSSPHSLFFGMEETDEGGGNDREARVLSSPIDLRSFDSASLSFRYWHDLGLGSNVDLNISTDGGLTYQYLGWVSNTDGLFKDKQIDLTSYAGSIVQLGVTYERYSDTPESGEGFYMDDIVVSGSDTSDRYQLSLEASDPVTLTVETPFNSPLASMPNTLVPAIEVLKPDGTALEVDRVAFDGKQSTVSFTAPIGGEYTVIVRAESGAGEYILENSVSRDAVIIMPSAGELRLEMIDNQVAAAMGETILFRTDGNSLHHVIIQGTTGSDRLVVNSDVINRLLPEAKMIQFIGNGADDEFEFTDTGWSMGANVMVGERSMRQAVHSSGATIQLDTSRAWRNVVEALDVNNQGGITASDALAVINELTERLYSASDGLLTSDGSAASPSAPGALARYLDVNGDGKVSPSDALQVINALAEMLPGNQSGESGELVASDLLLTQNAEVERLVRDQTWIPEFESKQAVHAPAMQTPKAVLLPQIESESEEGNSEESDPLDVDLVDQLFALFP
ncbi:choice-of-anchor Q domain-containing protein [Novipirellula aureliae]|uniref:choice-of-anchor Q domain-containing protein n=1 Tax=Novipirellula aureliae TaxID=2527966 RepID=UPI0018CF407A|nr:choice-of-anchor Q domain-containing protein [Novipirellula aureliae]